MKVLAVFKRKWMVLVGVFYLMTLLIGCAENDIAPNHQVEVQFRLLNISGEETKSFRQGEDIIFDYRMINKGNEAVFWFLDIGNFENLFTVSSFMPNQDNLVFGTPHEELKIYVNGLQMQIGTKLEPYKKLAIRMTWGGDWNETIFLGQEFNSPIKAPYFSEATYYGPFKYKLNEPLPKGSYVVALEQTIKFVDLKNLPVNKKIFFEVI
jgi:hypothetical protein